MKRENLIEFRGARTQAEMGRLYGVSQQSWNKWENGLTSPTVVTMKQIELDSGIPMEKIFSDVFNNVKSYKEVN